MEFTIPRAQSNGQQSLVRCSERPYRVREPPQARLSRPLDEYTDEHVDVKARIAR